MSESSRKSRVISFLYLYDKYKKELIRINQLHNSSSLAAMHIEATAEHLWSYLATASGMKKYLTDEVIASTDEIKEGDEIRIVIGDLINDAYCLLSEYPRRFRLKDRYRSLLADDSFIEYELITTFLLEEEAAITKVSVHLEGYSENQELMHWIKECSVLGWRQSLFNLKLIIELGLDLRSNVFGYPRLGLCNYSATQQQLEEKKLITENIRGNYIMEVFSGGPADSSGLQKGDIIVSLNGIPVPDYPEFVRALGRCSHIQVIPIVYYRGNKRYVTEAHLSQDELLTGLIDPTAESIRQVTEGKR